MEKEWRKLLPFRPRIAVGMGTCGAGNGAEAVFHAFADTIDKRGLDIHLARVGCFGFCAQEPLVNVRLPGRPLVILHRVQSNYIDEILDTVMMGDIPTDMALCKIEDWDHITAQIKYGDRLRINPFLAGCSVLQGTEEDRVAQLRADQP